jgi:hypothetical protein
MENNQPFDFGVLALRSLDLCPEVRSKTRWGLSDGSVLDYLIFLRCHHQKHTSSVTEGFPVDRAGISPAVVTGAHELILHAKITGQHKELLDSRVIVAWIVSTGIHSDQGGVELPRGVFIEGLQENTWSKRLPPEFVRARNQQSVLVEKNSGESRALADLKQQSFP